MSLAINWRRARLGLAVLAVLGTTLASISATMATASGEPAVRAEDDLAPIIGAESSRAIKNRYIIVFDRSVATSEVRKGRDKATGEGSKVHFEYSKVLKGFTATLTQKAVDWLRRNPKVSYLEADEAVEVTTTQPSAPWGLDRIDQAGLPLSGTYDYTSTGSGVTAYVIDTGIRATHGQFGGRVSGGYTTISDGNGTNDCNGHGTHVAGTIGGSTYGVAKAVRLVPVRVLDCSGIGTNSGIIAGIDWITQNAVKPAVANMSLGGAGSTSLDSAVASSIVSGITYAVAAGNNGEDACNASPARLAATITVGATTSTDARASFSNYGTCLDLFAPGASILSAGYSGDTATATMSGTSMATPHVAGVAALYLQTNPTALPSVVRDAIVDDATASVVTDAGTGSPTNLLYAPPAGFPAPVTATPTTTAAPTTVPTTVPTTSKPTTTTTTTAAPAACPALAETYSGSLTGTGDYEDEPNGAFYVASATGTHRGCVQGPAGTNFDLYLYKRSGVKWVLVAVGTSTSSTDNVSYTGTSGTYKWRVISKRGSGSFTLRIQRP